MINAERALDALGDRTRRRVFARLRDRTCSAGELAQGMNVTRSAVSQHLQVLKAAGLVVVRADGTRRLYQVDRRGVPVGARHLDHAAEQALVGAAAQQHRAVLAHRPEDDAAPVGIAPVGNGGNTEKLFVIRVAVLVCLSDVSRIPPVIFSLSVRL